MFVIPWLSSGSCFHLNFFLGVYGLCNFGAIFFGGVQKTAKIHLDPRVGFIMWIFGAFGSDGEALADALLDREQQARGPMLMWRFVSTTYRFMGLSEDHNIFGSILGPPIYGSHHISQDPLTGLWDSGTIRGTLRGPHTRGAS